MPLARRKRRLPMNGGRELISLVAEMQDLTQYRKENWTGTFEEYLDLVRDDPKITRNAFQRVYDMIISHGVETYESSRQETRSHYTFFDDPIENGKDGVFGLDV
ncbi:MAG: serine protein kinase [Pirellulaceae bacterium]|jgi:serine protein kinase